MFGFFKLPLTTAEHITMKIRLNKNKKCKMKKWPNNPTELLPYNNIASHIKEIINKGYKLFRKDEVKEFDYEGYDIGSIELQTNPSPSLRLTESFIKYEKKLGRNLIDIILNIMFLMGVEQGRRAERRDFKPIEELLITLESYREKNKNQRILIDELEIILDLKEKEPLLSEEEFRKKIQSGIESRRIKRIEELKNELLLDTSRSSFQFNTPQHFKFRDLEKLAKTLTKETCSLEQWKQLLEKYGWKYKDWKDKCIKKNVHTDFS